MDWLSVLSLGQHQLENPRGGGALFPLHLLVKGKLARLDRAGHVGVHGRALEEGWVLAAVFYSFWTCDKQMGRNKYAVGHEWLERPPTKLKHVLSQTLTFLCVWHKLIRFSLPLKLLSSAILVLRIREEKS